MEHACSYDTCALHCSCCCAATATRAWPVCGPCCLASPCGLRLLMWCSSGSGKKRRLQRQPWQLQQPSWQLLRLLLVAAHNGDLLQAQPLR
jgi:hypothetical protein